MFRMKEFTTTFAVLAGLLLSATAAQAQLPTSKAALMQEATRRMDVIAKKLKLTPDQVDKIKPLMNQEMEDVGAAREKYNASDKSDAAKKDALDSVQASRAKNHDQIQKVLTPEQSSKWADMVKSWKSDLKF